jgi:hypothetical protein
LIMQGDGNLVLYAPAGRVLWSSRTAGHPGSRLAVQADGNLVVYAKTRQPLWSSRTQGRHGIALSLQNDGNVVLRTAAAQPVWASGTAAAAARLVKPATTSVAALSHFFGPKFNASKAFCPFNPEVASIAGPTLTVSYPAGSSAPSSGGPAGGAQLCVPFAAGSRTDATLTYRLLVPVGYQFVKGGKLPGLYGGSEPFSGGKHTSNGWSMRLMWRSGGAGEVYGYISTTSGYGNDWGRGNFRFAADGRWHTVSEHVHLNTPGRSDGYVTLSYDGRVVVSQPNLSVTKTRTPIAGLFFSTFYGGHDRSWAPTATQQLEFSGFSVN